MVRKSVYEPFKTQINKMAELFSENVSWIKTNTQEAVEAVNSCLSEGVSPSLTAANINATVVENCKIYYQSASDAKTDVASYINKIISVNAQSARAVGDDFFAN